MTITVVMNGVNGSVGDAEGSTGPRASTSRSPIPGEPIPRAYRNPTGKNQFPNCPSKESPEFLNILREYHRETTNRKLVAELLKKDHGIEVSERTVTRRWKEMGLRASKGTEKTLDREAVIRLVAEQMALDPSGKAGQNTVKKQIALRTGIHLKRETVAEVQRMLDPAAAAARHPTARRQMAMTCEGPNDVWICDGHDKLGGYGFTLWGVRDKFSQRWLGLWVLPNNRIEQIVPYLWLKLVRDLGGIPRQSSSGSGSERTVTCGLSQALREALSTDPALAKPSSIFLRNACQRRNEKGWFDPRKDSDQNFPDFWAGGAQIFNDSNPTHRQLAPWFWPGIMQRELDKFRLSHNNIPISIQRQRDITQRNLPPNTTPDFVFTYPDGCGTENHLQTVDLRSVEAILADLETEFGNATNDWGVPEEFAERARNAVSALGLTMEQMDMGSAWVVFAAICGVFFA